MPWHAEESGGYCPQLLEHLILRGQQPPHARLSEAPGWGCGVCVCRGWGEGVGCSQGGEWEGSRSPHSLNGGIFWRESGVGPGSRGETAHGCGPFSRPAV